MLILDRYKHETVYIGEEIVIKVMGVHGARVTLGIEAPKEISVMREELLWRNAGHATDTEETTSCLQEAAALEPQDQTKAPLSAVKPGKTKIVYKRRRRPQTED